MHLCRTGLNCRDLQILLESTNCFNNTIPEDTALVPNSAGTLGGLPLSTEASAKFGTNVDNVGVLDETRSPPTDRLAYLKQSYSSKAFLLRHRPHACLMAGQDQFQLWFHLC